jgi:signal transduction histidine kinase
LQVQAWKTTCMKITKPLNPRKLYCLFFCCLLLAGAKAQNFNKDAFYALVDSQFVHQQYSQILTSFDSIENKLPANEKEWWQFERMIYEGDNYDDQEIYDSALLFFKQALAFAENKKNEAWMAESNFRIGKSLHYTDQFDESHKHSIAALNYYEKANSDVKKHVDVLGQLALTFLSWKRSDDCKKYGARGVELAKTMEDKNMLVYLLIIYCQGFVIENDWKGAMPLLLQADSVFQKIPAGKQMEGLGPNVDQLMTKGYVQTGDYQKAYDVCQRVFRYYEQKTESFGMVSASMDWAEAAIKLGRVDEGIQLLENALTGFGQPLVGGFTINIPKMLAKAYAMKGDHKKAYHYDTLANGRVDVVRKANVQKLMSDADMKYETSKKEAELVKTKSRQQLLWIGLAALSALAVGVFFYNRKINKQKKELAELNGVKNRLFSIISHDMRGLLLPLQRAGRIMNHHVKNNDIDKVKSTAQTIQENAENVSQMMDNLLHWSFSQLNGYAVKLEHIDAKAEIDALLAAFNMQASAKEIQLVNNLPADVRVTADRGSFNVIFRNLIANALKYAPEKGMVKIDGQQLADEIKIAVQDNGIGIPKEMQAQLFANSTDKIRQGTHGEKGVGLGLQLVQWFAGLNKGSISLQSELQKGTTFTVSLPSAA